MEVFEYEGILEGKKVKGEIFAKSEEEVFQLLESKGILPLEVKKKQKKKLRFKLNFEFNRVPLEDIAFSLLQLATLLESGIPLNEALFLLEKQTENEKLAAAFVKIRKEIEEGKSVAQAFKDAKIFPDFLPEMLKGAQTGENLEYIFKIAGEYLQKLSEIRGKIISSIIYPSFIILFSFLSVIVAVKFVLPKLISVLESFGKEPPLVTRFLIITVNGLIYLSPLLVGLGLYLYLKRKEIFTSHKFGKFLIRIPVIGKIVLYLNLSRFARVVNMLLKASAPLTEALTLAVNSISLPFLREELKKLIPEVEKGKSFAKLVRNIEFLPPLFVNLWETGESGGELEKMTQLIADTFEKEALKKIDFWIKMIEPLTILFIALIVGIIVVSVILPMSQLSAGVK
jgi:type IV pilus assembly protein PilC